MAEAPKEQTNCPRCRTTYGKRHCTGFCHWRVCEACGWTFDAFRTQRGFMRERS